MKKYASLMAAVLVALMVVPALAANTGTQVVAFSVPSIQQFAVTGTIPTLAIAVPAAGSPLVPVTNASGTYYVTIRR